MTVSITASFGAPPPWALERTEVIPAAAIFRRGSPGKKPPPCFARASALATMSSPWSAKVMRSWALSTLPWLAPGAAGRGRPSRKMAFWSFSPLLAASSAPRAAFARSSWIFTILSSEGPEEPPTTRSWVKPKDFARVPFMRSSMAACCSSTRRSTSSSNNFPRTE